MSVNTVRLWLNSKPGAIAGTSVRNAWDKSFQRFRSDMDDSETTMEEFETLLRALKHDAYKVSANPPLFALNLPEPTGAPIRFEFDDHIAPPVEEEEEEEEEPFPFEAVLFQMDWEDDAESLAGNPNLGSWEGTPTYEEADITTSGPITGSASLITGGDDCQCVFRDTPLWTPADGDWTVEVSCKFNGVIFSDGENSTELELMAIHDDEEQGDPFGLGAAFLVRWSGNPESGHHEVHVYLSEDGENEDKFTISLGEVMETGNHSYHILLERHGDTINAYFAEIGVNPNLIKRGSANLSEGYTIFNNNVFFSLGHRSKSVTLANAASGRYDNFRLVDGVALAKGADTLPLVLPHPRPPS